MFFKLVPFDLELDFVGGDGSDADVIFGENEMFDLFEDA